MRKLDKWHEFGRQHAAIIEALLMLYVLLVLFHTDSYFAVYLIMGLAAFAHFSLSLCGSAGGLDPREKKFIQYMAIGIGLCITLANYRLFSSHHLNPVKGAMVYMGCYYMVRHDLQLLYHAVNNRSWRLAEKGWSPRKVFCVSFLVIAAVDFVYLFGSAFPGTLTSDSVDQVYQILTGSYANHHPFWQTQVIRFWLSMGLSVFHGNLTDAIAVYSSFLVCFMAGCFAYMLMTFRKAGLPWKVILPFLVFVAAMPYNISYSVTMWKNIMFSGAMLVLVVTLFCILHQLGNRYVNLGLLAGSGLCVCLWQSNGIPAFILTMCIIVYVMKESRKQLAAIGAIVACLALILVGPALKSLGVRQTEINEALSVPQQQMARVLHDKKKVPAEDKEILSRYADVSLMAAKYNPRVSDNTKGLVHGDYFLFHKADYFKVWAKWGLRYPWEYGKAWIEETRGYWNGGYQYWIWSKGINERARKSVQLDARAVVKVKKIDKLYTKYFSLYTRNMLVVFLSIGLHVWLMCLLGGYCLLKGKRDFILAVPALSIIATLLLTTPVFSEFRYAYSIFTTLPMVLVAAFYEPLRIK